MRSKFKWIFTLLVAFTMQFSFAQEKTVTGNVSDELGPLPGATVVVKGTSRGVTTDFDGNYSITAKQGDVLEVSFAGKQKKSVTVGASNAYDIVLGGMVGEEIVLITDGYNRTRTVATSISAATTVSSEVIENRPNASFLSSLQGTSPGASILSSSGSPGSAKIDVLIRGVSSINASTEPLIVIDGVPTSSAQFRSLNQNDISTVTILRDAAATSIYGNKGANGVIVLTTKTGKFNSGLRVTYDVVTGTNTLPENKYNMSNAKEVLTIEKRKNTGFGATLTDAEIAAWNIDTDWRKVFFNVDVTQQHNLGLTFGGENLSSYTSFSYYEQGGMVPTTDFKRFTVRNNLNGKSNNGKFTYNSQVALAHSKRNELNQETNGNVNNNTIQNPLHGSVMGLPYAESGIFATGQELLDGIGTDFNGANDTYVLQDILRPNSLPSWFTENAILANVSASYKLTPSLTFSNRSGVDYKQNDRVFARSPWSYLALVVQTTNSLEFGGFETRSNEQEFNFTNIANLNYNKTFNDAHTFDFGAYLEYSKSHRLFNGFTQNGLNPLTYVPGAGTGYAPFIPGNPAQNVPTVVASKFTAGTLSYFATADYDYKERFGFGATIRRDATYKFIDENKWGTFWSVAGRWNIDKEAFMEGSTFSMLKLRASYGTQGNQNISNPVPGLNPLFLDANIVRDLYAVGSGYNNLNGIGLGNIANPTLQWEEITQSNIGVDFILLNSKLEGNLDVYRKQTDLLYNTVTLSGVTSLYGRQGNNGTLRNEGVELLLKYNIVKNEDLKLSVFANGSYNKNEIIAIDETQDQSGNNNVNLPGGPVREWNLIPYIGVNQANGNLLYLDKDGNATENPDQVADRRLLGKSPVPVYQGGFGFNADYKGFFADALFTYVADVWRIDNQLRWAYNNDFIGDDNVSSDLLNAWTAENPTNFPSINASNQTLDSDSDRFLKDASFLRLKNLTVGYNFSQKMLENTFIKSLKFFVQGENLATWTKWRGFDPENTQVLSVTAFPNPRTISFGASIGF